MNWDAIGAVGQAAVKRLWSCAVFRSLQSRSQGHRREAAVGLEMHRPLLHLWTQVFAQLKHHVRPGETPLDALNGILREVYGGSPITTAASIRTRTLTPAEVHKLRLGPDVRMKPHDRKSPIVVVRVGHRGCVVDGNKRVRAWKRDPTYGLDAIVIG